MQRRRPPRTCPSSTLAKLDAMTLMMTMREMSPKIDRKTVRHTPLLHDFTTPRRLSSSVGSRAQLITDRGANQPHDTITKSHRRGQPLLRSQGLRLGRYLRPHVFVRDVLCAGACKASVAGRRQAQCRCR